MKQKQKEKQDVKILERGNIYFFYRPEVEEASPKRLADVQRTYIVLSPHGKNRYRLIILGKKQLPEVERHDRYWGFVDRSASSNEPILNELRQETYRTKTRGERIRSAARPAGEGVYVIALRGSNTHLAYVLELPEHPGEVQQALAIREEADYVIAAKNPEVAPERGLSEERRANFPQRLREKFGDRRWVAVHPPDFLDYEGAELVLIGAAGDVEEELGIWIEAQPETERTAEIFNGLRLHKSEHPVKPLFEGTWE